MSNIETWSRLKMGRRFSSALIMRRFFLSCRPFRLMYAQSFLVTSVRGMGLLPITSESAALGCMAFMNAAFGFRLAPDFFAAFLVDFFAAFRAGFLAVLLDFFAAFFLAAIVVLPEWVRAVSTIQPPAPAAHKVGNPAGDAIGSGRFFPRGTTAVPSGAGRSQPGVSAAAAGFPFWRRVIFPL